MRKFFKEGYCIWKTLWRGHLGTLYRLNSMLHYVLAVKFIHYFILPQLICLLWMTWEWSLVGFVLAKPLSTWRMCVPAGVTAPDNILPKSSFWESACLVEYIMSCGAAQGRACDWVQLIQTFWNHADLLFSSEQCGGLTRDCSAPFLLHSVDSSLGRLEISVWNMPHSEKLWHTAIVACIKNEQEEDYRDVTRASCDWCLKNCLCLGLWAGHWDCEHIQISRFEHSQKLDCSLNSDCLYKKAKTFLFFFFFRRRL